MAKVGFLFTIGLLLMSLTVLSLALFIAEVEKGSNEKVTELVRYDRLHDLDTSINEAFREIFRVSSGISIIYTNKTNNTFFIKENLPNGNSTRFAQNMTAFEIFLNKTSNSPTDNVTLYLANLANVHANLPLVITPYNITYTHFPSFGSNTIIVSPKQFNFYGYNITITTPINPSTTLQTFKFVSGTDMIVKIKIIGPTQNRIINQRVSSSGLSYLQVRDSGGTINLFNISFNNSKLWIDKQAGVAKIDVSTGIMMRGDQIELLRIWYPRKLYNVTLPQSKIKTSSHVMIESLQV